MRLPLFQIDAFSNRAFGGNPAAVVPLEQWLDDTLLQAIAAENNLSETAFMVAQSESRYALRWFTPTTEVDLCGHATLAAAWVHFFALGGDGDTVTFDTRSGALPVQRQLPRLVMDFPARPGEETAPPPALLSALGINEEQVEAVIQSRDTLVVLNDHQLVTQLQPDMNALATLDTFGIIVSAAGTDCDFVSRFFAPRQGVPEDPVTGSAHCTLAPWWAGKLGRQQLHARQVSGRGGELWCTVKGDRVQVAGEAVCTVEGVLILEAEQ